MHASKSFPGGSKGSLTAALFSGLVFAGLAIASPAAFASGDSDTGGAAGGGAAGAATGAGTGAPTHAKKTDLTTCEPGQVWDAKQHKCLAKRSGVLPDPELTEYAYALAKA